MRQDSERCIDRLLTYFSLCDDLVEIPSPVEWEVPKAQRSFINVPLSHFDNADATLAYPDELGREQLTKSPQGFFMDAKPSDLSGMEWDMPLISMAKGPGCTNSHTGRLPLYAATRIRRVPLSEIRGFFPLKTGVVVDYAQATIFADGSYTPHREYIEKRGPVWTVVGQPREVDPAPADDQCVLNIQISMGLAFTRFYEWTVRLRAHPKLPSIALVTDPVGARELFKQRDVPMGKSRREALKHWVSGHWRKSREIDEGSWISEFLRGADRFTWNGLGCQIVPSAYDLMRNKRSKTK